VNRASPNTVPVFGVGRHRRERLDLALLQILARERVAMRATTSSGLGSTIWVRKRPLYDQSVAAATCSGVPCTTRPPPFAVPGRQVDDAVASG
jgi:hypothetical protein